MDWSETLICCITSEGVVQLGQDNNRTNAWDKHVVLLHGSEGRRRGGLVSWVRRGLELQEKIIYAERVDGSRSRRLFSVMQEAGVDLAQAALRGQVQVMTPQEFYAPGRLSSLVKQGLAAYPGIRLSAERATALSVLPRQAHDELEWDVEGLCHGERVSVLCQYRSTEVPDVQLGTLVASHGRVHDELLSSTRYDGGMTFAGEIDLSNWSLVREAIRAALPTAARVFQLDLSALTFLDVGGVRTLQTATERFRDAGGLVQFVASGEPYRILDLLGVAEVPSLVLRRPLEDQRRVVESPGAKGTAS